MEVHRHGEKQEGQGRSDDHFFPGQGPGHHRLVEADEPAADGVFFFRMDLAHPDGIGQPAEPPGLKGEIVQMGQEQAQGRVQSNGQHRRHQHGEVFGIGQGFEHPALGRLQGQNRQEGHRDDQQGEEAGAGHLFHGLDNDLPVVAQAPAAVPFLQFFMGLLHHHDGGVHHGAHGDDDASQRHDVGRDAHQPERDESDQHRHRDGDDGDQGAGEVPEEKQDHHGHGQQHFDEGGPGGGDGPLDQFGTVVDRDDFDPRRQTGFDFLEFGLHPVNDLQGVLALAHDDDAGDRFAGAVQVDHAPAEVRSGDYLSHILDPDGRAGVTGGRARYFQNPGGCGHSRVPAPYTRRR